MGDAILVQQVSSSGSSPTYSSGVTSPSYGQSITLSYAASWMAAVVVGNFSSLYISGGAISDSFPTGNTATLAVTVIRVDNGSTFDIVYLSIDANHTSMTCTSAGGSSGYFYYTISMRQLYYFYGM